MNATMKIYDLCSLRFLRDKTQQEIANELGIHLFTWQRYEHGRRMLPSGMISFVATVLNYSDSTVLTCAQQSFTDGQTRKP